MAERILQRLVQSKISTALVPCSRADLRRSSWSRSVRIWKSSRYIHLNPLQTLRYRSGRSLKPAATTRADVVRERVNHIRSYPWSSYASYLELRACPPWLETDGILSNFEDGASGRRHAGYRKFVEEPVRQGSESTIVDRALTGLAIGSPEFVAKVHASAIRRVLSTGT